MATDVQVRDLIEKHIMGEVNNTQFNFLLKTWNVSREQESRIMQQMSLDQCIAAVIIATVLCLIGGLFLFLVNIFS